MAQTQQLANPQTRRWSKAEYHSMAELGWFRGQRAELVEGEIMVMSPQGFGHSAATYRVGKALEVAFGAGFWVRTQLPLDLGRLSEPEPDVSVVQGSVDDYTDHPTATELVVEVSDTTLRYDRGAKLELYARSGVPESWIVNLTDEQLEVYRDPGGDSYSREQVLKRGERVSPLASPQSVVEVAALLGR